MTNQHVSILIHNVQKLETPILQALYAEMKLKYVNFATFQLSNETIIIALNITEHAVNRLIEHYAIEVQLAAKQK